jgi:serine/threonine protein phosphatase PrpC
LDNAVHQYVYAANDVICKRIREMRSHLGTTLALAIITEDAARLYNIGDSRIYAMTGGKLRQVSEDHTVSEQKVKLGILTKEQAKKDRDRHTLTRHLGVFEEDVSISATSYEPLPRHEKYKLLLCSDGLSDMVEDDRIEEILNASKSPKEAVGNLIAEALKNGGRDNVTCIVIEDEGSKKPDAGKSAYSGDIAEEATVKVPLVPEKHGAASKPGEAEKATSEPQDFYQEPTVNAGPSTQDSQPSHEKSAESYSPESDSSAPSRLPAVIGTILAVLALFALIVGHRMFFSSPGDTSGSITSDPSSEQSAEVVSPSEALPEATSFEDDKAIVLTSTPTPSETPSSEANENAPSEGNLAESTQPATSPATATPPGMRSDATTSAGLSPRSSPPVN